MESDRVQVKAGPRFLLGAVFPEFSLQFERVLISTDLALRKSRFPRLLRYPFLNFLAWLSGPLWFSLFLLAFLLVLLIVCLLSFGILVPFVLPLAGLLLGYTMLVPVWFFSVYFFSSWPLLAATCAFMSSEALAEWNALHTNLQTRRMVQHLNAADHPPTQHIKAYVNNHTGGNCNFSDEAQRNPQGGATWLSKQELVAMYQRRNLLDIERTELQKAPTPEKYPPVPPPGPP